MRHLLALLTVTLVVPPVMAGTNDTTVTLENVKKKLESPFHQTLLRKTYDSIRDRVTPDGYFPESLTGAYPGMFPRVSGPLARLFIDTGNPELAEKILHYCIQGMLDNGMERIPHVIGERTDSGSIPLVDGDDQVDGQAHVILGWALLAQQRGRTPFEDLSYPIAAKILDRSTTEPYLSENIGWRIHPGLVRNINLEHSRDGQFWDTYDFLTQSFIASALENMIPIAARRCDRQHEHLWTERLEFLNKNIAENMTREFNGKQVYLEMLLPTGREPEPFPGIGWLNLAPIPSGWKSVDSAIFKNTIDTWHSVAQIKWNGPNVTSSDWLPDGYTDRFGKQQTDQVIGKVLGWDMVYCFRAGEYKRVCDSLDFLEQVNTHSLFAEAFSYDSETGQWKQHDPGNGEQACWWTWCMTVIREEAGLSALPAPETSAKEQ
ncbi:MAG: hypothetical protein ABIH23_12585 [bacterium]